MDGDATGRSSRAAGAATPGPAATPIVFGGCLGWHHAPPPDRAGGRGVVLCAPYGYEALCTHRHWRTLADRLAAAGMPVLRFDYPGVGDSAGDPAPGRLEDWVAAALAAADWLTCHGGATEVAFCGLRLGGLLAAAAAARRPEGAAALALLAPVVSGRTYVRELTLLAVGAPDAAVPDPDWLEATGFALHRDDATLLRGWDLRTLAAGPGPVRRALLLEDPTQPALASAAATSLDEAGVAVRRTPFPGYAAFMNHAHLSEWPEAAFAAVVDWLALGAPAPGPARPDPAPPRLTLPDGSVETPRRFGPDGGLFGVLCEPARAAPGAPAVLLLNTGANPRTGNGRLGVALARHLAGLGVTSLRMDGAGIGDSAAAGPSSRLGHGVLGGLHHPSRRAEAAAGLDLLEACGHPRAMAFGLCTGAYQAFHAGLVDPRVVGLVLVNPPLFEWRRPRPESPWERLDLEALARAEGAPTNRTVPVHRRLLRPLARRGRRWHGAGRALLGRLASRAGLAVDRLGVGNRFALAGRWMRALAGRGVEVLMVYSAGDAGLMVLEAEFGPGGRRLDRHATVRRVVVPEREHAFHPRTMQRALFGLVEAQLRGRLGLVERAG